MSGLDGWISHFASGGALGLVVAFLLGLRHATDPDHLTAVSTLVLSDDRSGARQAGLLGLTWGLGHATTLFAFGLPVVWFRRYLPEEVQRAAEVVIGLAIIGLAVRLLIRWRRGYFHTHSHTHGSIRHAHPHVHEERKSDHAAVHFHSHAEELGRSPLAAYGIGLIHGMGGSAIVGVLLVGAATSREAGILALILFAGATAVSMALVSSAFGYILARGFVASWFIRLVPILGSATFVFGVWYALGAIGLG
jgi:high-affinity nickel permease